MVCLCMCLFLAWQWRVALKPCFLTIRNGNFSSIEYIENGNEKVFPKERNQIPYEPYGYYEPSVPEKEELFRRVKAELDLWLDLDVVWKDVLTCCVLLSYLQEKLQTIPYVLIVGDTDSGKTTVLNMLKWLCYRPLCGLIIPPADMFGYLEDSDGIGCILEDEIQGINKDTDKIKIYKSGYKKGACVPRTLITSNNRIIKYYRTFCFKTCASEQIPQVKGFMERFLLIQMVEGYPKKDWADVSAEDEKRFQNLRNALLEWRMLGYQKDLPQLDLPFKGRHKELWKPILQIANDLPVYNSLLEFAKAQENERLDTRQKSLEGHIVKAVINVYNRYEGKSLVLPFLDIWTELACELDGKIDAQRSNEMDTVEFGVITKNKVGYRLREILSGKSNTIRVKDSEGNNKPTTYSSFDLEKLKRVAKKYGYDLVTKLPTEPTSDSDLIF